MGTAVLVVDDDETIREFIGMALAEEGYRVAEAPNGAAALDLLARQRPCVILLDMRMPVMDGWEFARRYRAEHPERAPIIVMTAAADAFQRCREVNGDACLPKPFDVDQLLALVEQKSGAPGPRA